MIIILSFALLNFYQPYKFIPKTSKYFLLVKLTNLNILYFFLKHNLNQSIWFSFYRTPSHLIYLFNVFFKKTLWLFFKKMILKQRLTYISNLETSFSYFFIQNSLKTLNFKPYYPTKSITDSQVVRYSQPIQIVKFSIHKHTYNTFILYNLVYLTESYLLSYKSYNLTYNFIFLKNTMWLYTFLNQFYIKVSHL